MNFSREPNELMEKLAHNQAYLFELSSKEKLPSYPFIKMYMCSKGTESLDDLIAISEDEIYQPIKSKIKRRGNILPSGPIHWIGYIYRCLNYLYEVPSRVLLSKVPPKYLLSLYPSYHSLDPVKASMKIYEDKLKESKGDLPRLLSLMKNVYGF